LFKNYQTQIGQNVATQQQPVASENSANPQEIFKKKPATGKPMQMKGKDGKVYSNMPTPTAQKPMQMRGKDGKTYSSIYKPTGNAQSDLPGLDSLIAKYNLQPKSAMNADGAIRAPRMQPNTQYKPRPKSTSWVAR